MDSAFYAKKVVRACRRAGARFSVTVRMDAAIKRAIATIGEDAWVPIRYPQAIWDEDEQRWISDAQIAETRYTALAGTKYEITARLIARHVTRRNPKHKAGQDELFAPWRHHAIFTDSPFTLAQAEAQHRGAVRLHRRLVNTRRVQAGLGDRSPDEYEAAWYPANIGQPDPPGTTLAPAGARQRTLREKRGWLTGSRPSVPAAYMVAGWTASMAR